MPDRKKRTLKAPSLRNKVPYAVLFRHDLIAPQDIINAGLLAGLPMLVGANLPNITKNLASAFVIGFEATRRALQDELPTRSQPGAPANVFDPEIFEGLAAAYWRLFGAPPRTRDKNSERGGPATIWARALLNAAAAVVDAAMLNPRRPDGTSDADPFINSVKAIVNLSEAMLARRLEEGWQRWKQVRPDYYLIMIAREVLRACQGIAESG